ncbi:hypothetical protein [Jidongwangia harbinensis]|uniref:hypothetical protein n=1 Tax=Jidongwangia harbinensis TaxID=2878561 RepID=UPI001CD9DB2C|nr:hypothetical protein [Jidongwangia harbinensis]MCA2217869.1 hypothetical protein [Jidongwangia harbinensis]
MSRMIRSRRAPVARDQPMYARLLRLRHLAPSGFLCFVFLEGAVVLGILLALAELVSWWGVLVLPLTVALMVKLNDVVAGALTRPASPVATAGGPIAPAPRDAPVLRPAVAADWMDDVALGRARTVDLRNSDNRVTRQIPAVSAVDASALNGPPGPRNWNEDYDLREQRARQSASRRYE